MQDFGLSVQISVKKDAENSLAIDFSHKLYNCSCVLLRQAIVSEVPEALLRFKSFFLLVPSCGFPH